MMAYEKITALGEYEVLKSVGHFFKQEPLPLEFVLPSLLRNSVGVLVAAGSTGKSFYAIQYAMCVATGEYPFGLYGGAEIEQGSVAYVALENPLDVFWSRIHSIGKHLCREYSDDEFHRFSNHMENIHLHSLYGRGFRPMDTDDLTASAQFKQTIAAVQEQGARLVIIDTYSRFLAGHSEQDNAVASTIVSILEQLCHEANVAVLIVHHTNKASQFSGEQGNQNAARGASALTDNARFQLNMWTMPSDTAAKYGIPEDKRKSYVFAEATKANHMSPQGQT